MDGVQRMQLLGGASLQWPAMDSQYRPDLIEERWQRAWEEEGLYEAEPGSGRGRRTSIAVPPPNVTGELHMGHAMNGTLPGRAHPLASDAGLRRPLAAGLRPRRDRDPERGRAGSGQGGPHPAGSRPRGVRRARLGVARAVRPRHHAPVPAAGGLARLPARALHDGRGLRPGRDALLRASPRRGWIYRDEPHRQLVPTLRQRRSRISRSSTRTSTTRSTTSATRSRTARVTSPWRRCGRRRSSPTSESPSIPGTTAMQPSSGRRPIVPVVERRVPIIADERVQAELRHRGAQDHAGPRSARLRDRPRPRPPRADRDRARRAHERRGRRASRA